MFAIGEIAKNNYNIHDFLFRVACFVNEKQKRSDYEQRNEMGADGQLEARLC